MATMIGRLVRLEERIPGGCPTCRTWGPAAYQITDGDLERSECCPSGGRYVPIHLVRHLVLPDGLWEAV